MKKNIIIVIAMTILSAGCSHLQRPDHQQSTVDQVEAEDICKSVRRHKSVIRQCRQ